MGFCHLHGKHTGGPTVLNDQFSPAISAWVCDWWNPMYYSLCLQNILFYPHQWTVLPPFKGQLFWDTKCQKCIKKTLKRPFCTWYWSLHHWPIWIPANNYNIFLQIIWNGYSGSIMSDCGCIGSDGNEHSGSTPLQNQLLFRAKVRMRRLQVLSWCALSLSLNTKL